MSGHSKWSTIKHKKGAADKKRGAIFTKLAKAVTVAAQNGGGDPDTNFTLRLAVDKARAANMPKDNIEDNSNRSVTNIKTIFNKNGGQLLNSGSLDFMFSRKTVIEFPVPEGRDLEELELELIDAGLEELSVDEGVVSVIGDYTAFAQLSQAVEALGINATKSGLQRLPNQPIELTEEQMVEVEAILDKLEDDDDVQAVFTNLA